MRPKSNHKCEGEDVGYGKPPKQFQFQKGQSGNPLGRPKKNKTNVELLNELLDVKVLVNGKPISKREALMLSIVNDAIKGKASARNTILALVRDEDAELEPFEETLDDKIAYHEAQHTMMKRKKEGES